MLDYRAFKLHTSRIHGLLLVALIAAALIVCLSLHLNFFLKFGLLMAIVSYSWIVFNHHVLQNHPDAILCVTHEEKGHWLLTTRSGDFSAQLLGDSTLTHWVSVLRFRALNDQKIRSTVIFRDSLPNDAYRQLMVRLRMF